MLLKCKKRCRYLFFIKIFAFLFVNIKAEDNNGLTNHSEYIVNENSTEKVVSIAILFHLYNLSLLDEFIGRINNFISKNNVYKYYIIVNIPIGKNIDNCDQFQKYEIEILNKRDQIYKKCIALAPYHPHLITMENCLKLHKIRKYIKTKLAISSQNVQIIYTQNRGVDVGGFLLALDQIIKQKIKHDYIIKLHTKTKDGWRKKLLRILDIDLNKYIPKYQYIYACKSYLSPNVESKSYFGVLPHMNRLLRIFDLPEKNWQGSNHCAGTMFIVSSKITNFFEKYDRVRLFNMLNLGFPKVVGRHLIEHGFEVFFGYLIEEYLKLTSISISNK